MSDPSCVHKWQVYVHPQRDTIGVGMEGSPQSLSLAEGKWAGPLEMPEK